MTFATLRTCFTKCVFVVVVVVVLVLVVVVITKSNQGNQGSSLSIVCFVDAKQRAFILNSILNFENCNIIIFIDIVTKSQKKYIGLNPEPGAIQRFAIKHECNTFISTVHCLRLESNSSLKVNINFIKIKIKIENKNYTQVEVKNYFGDLVCGGLFMVYVIQFGEDLGLPPFSPPPLSGV